MRFGHLIAAAGLLCAAPALAQDAREIDGWRLNDDGQSCAISLDSEDGAVMTMINDGTGGADGLAFIDENLTGVTDTKPDTLQYSTDGKNWTDFRGYGIVLKDGAQGYHLAYFPIEMFSAKRLTGTLQLRRDGTVIHSFPLDKVYRPAVEMAACGKKYG